MSDRPKAVKTEILDTREKCQNCKGTGRIPAFMCEPDNEEDGTNNCGVCSGFGFTGHYPGVHVKIPSANDWREYADSLERTVAALEREVAELRGQLAHSPGGDMMTYVEVAVAYGNALDEIAELKAQPVAGSNELERPCTGSPFQDRNAVMEASRPVAGEQDETE